MKINEVTGSLKTYIATVKVKGSTMKTSIQADNPNHARQLLQKLYGADNVTSVSAA